MVSHQFIIDRGENGSQSRPIIFDSDGHVLKTVVELIRVENYEAWLTPIFSKVYYELMRNHVYLHAQNMNETKDGYGVESEEGGSNYEYLKVMSTKALTK